MSSVDLYTFITGNTSNAEHFERFLAKVGLTSYYEFVCLVKEIFANESKLWGPTIRTLNKNYLDNLPVSERVRMNIRSKISREEYTRDIFDDAVKEVWDFLSKEVYKEFIFYLQISEKNDKSNPSTSSVTSAPDPANDLIAATIQRSQNFNLGAGPSNQPKVNKVDCSNRVATEILTRVLRDQDCDEVQNQSSGGGQSDDDLHHDTSPITEIQEQEERPGVSSKCIINTCDNFEDFEAPRWPSAKKSDDVRCFARKLIKKLEHVKQQRDYMAFLTKKLKEQAGDKLSSDDDDILNDHVKNVWADDSPPAKREYKCRDCPSNPYHTKHAVPKSRSFPTPSTSKGDPDSGISVVSRTTCSSNASTSRSGRTEEFSSCSTASYDSARPHGGSSERPHAHGKSKRWWKKVKELPAVVQYHGNSVPISFVIPTATDKITLRVFKKFLPHKGNNFRYLFQYSGLHGVGVEEIFEDTSEIPVFNGKIVATIKPFF